MPKPLMQTRTYAVAFDTRKHAGYIHAVKVTMSEDIVDLDEQVRVDLSDDPAYKDLYTYCLANPPRK